MLAALVWLQDPPSQWASWGASTRGYRLVFLIVLGAVVYAAATLAGGLRLRHLEKGAS
jgi:peptidoglycan biosynthesis protein MviN/MurJ (putative lipid II flippase)